MFASLFDKIAEQLAENGTIEPEDTELYAYGLQQGMVIILNIITILAVGAAFGMLWQSFIFILAYIPLRTFSGGYHARTQTACYFLGIVLTVVVLFGIRYLPMNLLITAGLAAIAGIVIYIFAPVEDVNKPLDEKEIAIYSKTARKILAFELSLTCVALLIGKFEIAHSVSISLLALAIMLLLGRTNNKRFQ